MQLNTLKRYTIISLLFSALAPATSSTRFLSYNSPLSHLADRPHALSMVAPPSSEPRNCFMFAKEIFHHRNRSDKVEQSFRTQANAQQPSYIIPRAVQTITKRKAKSTRELASKRAHLLITGLSSWSPTRSERASERASPRCSLPFDGDTHSQILYFPISR